jgi:DNA-binding IclR family transcriptional regulator
MDWEQTRHPTRGQSVCPFFEALAQEVNETIDLATLYGTRVRFIDQVVPGRRLRATSIFGEQFPAHSTANGKALLAELPVPTVEATFPAQLERFTANTITIAAPTDRFHGAQDAFADAVRATARDATASLLRVS